MHGFRWFLAAIVAFSTLPASAADKPSLPKGNYVLAYFPRPLSENLLAVVRVTDDDGKPSVEVLDGGPSRTRVSEFTVKADTVSATVTVGGSTVITLEATIDPKNPKQILGSLGDDNRLFPAALVPTDAEKLAKPLPPDVPDEFKQAMKFLSAPQLLRIKARRSKDDEEKKKLRDEADDAAKLAEEKVPALFRKVFAEHPGTPAAVSAADELLDRSAKLNPPPTETLAWANALTTYAARYGSRVEYRSLASVAETLTNNPKLAATALKFAEQAKTATESAPAGIRVRVMKALALAQERVGNTPAAMTVRTEIEKLELVLDKEYLDKVPPFKTVKFPGRKNMDANRVAVLELFTGSQCPPCVAADVGFDAMAKAYKPSEVVLLQYHLHIPGPDALTNPDAIARQDYYTETYPDDIRGTPSTLVNGKPEAGGGGSLEDAKDKFGDFRAVVAPILEKSAIVTFDGSARRTGDTITATVILSPMKPLPATAKLRLVLVEDHIRYQGGNGVRFHHNVVRSLFGKPDGVKARDLVGGRHSATVNVAELRKQLSEYLEKFARDEAPFSSPDRPLELKNLKVIALVQDDDTREILQAIELPVSGR